MEKADSVLSVENFTFFKEPIGMESDLEILRYAKTRKVKMCCLGFLLTRNVYSIRMTLATRN